MKETLRMKTPHHNATRFISAGLCLLFGLLANHAVAVTTTWDPQGTVTTPNTHYSGSSSFYTGSLAQTWENAEWSTSQTGQATPQAWAENTAAVFAVHTGTGTPAFTVTMNANHTVAGIFDGPLTPNPCQVTIAGTGTMILGPANLNAFDLSSNTSDPGYVTINVPLSGASTAALCMESTGQVYLNGTNTFPGNFQLGYSGALFSGIVNFTNTLGSKSASFGTSTIIVTNTGRQVCALVVEGSGATTVTNAITWAGPNASSNTNQVNFVGNSAGVTFSGPQYFTNNAFIGSGGGTGNKVTFSGVLSGQGGIFYNVSTPSLAGTLILSGANTYSGNTVVTNGILKLGANGGIPNGTGKGNVVVDVNGTATGWLDVGGYSGSVNGLSGAGVVTNSTGTGTLTVGSNNVSSGFSGIIAGALNFAKTGTGIQTNSGANTYTGVTTVGSGTLQLYVPAAIPSTSPTVIASGATLDVNSQGVTIGALSGSGLVTNNEYQTLTVSGNATPLNGLVYQQYSCYSGALTNGSLLKDGTHAMALRGSNTFDGSLTFNNGTLSVGAAPNRLPTTLSLSYNAPALFQLDANSQTLASFSGNGYLNLGGGTLIDNETGNPGWSGVIQDSELPGSSTALGNGLRGYYYTNIDMTVLAAVRDDSTVNIPDVQTSLPAALLPYKTNEISVRWLGQVLTTVSGTYAFVTKCDDGCRLWVNGSLLIDDWTTHGATARTNTISLIGNTRYDIVMEYFNGTDGGSATLSWIPPTDLVPSLIPTGNLFLPGAGSLVMNGSGTLSLYTANTYSGTTIVSNGTLVAQADGALGSGNVVVNNGANLTLQSGSTNGYMSPSACLVLGSSSPASALVSLNFGGEAMNVLGLSFDGGATWQLPGTYGCGASGAGNPNDTIFTPGQGGMIQVVGTTTSVGLASSSSPSAAYGSVLTLTATVTPSSATGTVTFYDGANLLGIAPVNGSGIASMLVSNLSVAYSPHSLTAKYNGDAANIPSTSAAVSQSTTALGVTVSITVSNKVYDATTTGSVSNAVITGLLPVDTNYVHFVSAVATFAGKDVGNSQTVTFSSVTLAGSQSGNYTVSSAPSTTANITPKALTVASPAVTPKTYDGTNTATITGSLQTAEAPGSGTTGDGKPYTSDTVTLNLSGTFNNANAGTGKAVISTSTLTGTQAFDYTLTQPGSLTGTINTAATSPAIVSSANPSTLGNSVTFTFTATSTTPTTNPPTGTVSFYTNQFGVTPLVLAGSSSLVSNTPTTAIATFTTALLAAITNTVQGGYPGDGNFTGSSNSLSQVVNSVICSATNLILSVTYNGGNSVTLTNIGTTNAVYYVVSQTDVSQPLASWTPVAGSTNTNTAGIWTITLVNPSPIFYRVRAVNPCD